MSLSGRAGAKTVLVEADDRAAPVRGRRGEDPPAAAEARRRLENGTRQPPAGRPVLRAQSRWSRPAGTARRRCSRSGPTRDDRPFAWVSLDRRDNDPVVLLRHVAAAINEIIPVDPRLLDALAAPGASIWTTVLPRVAALVAAADDCVLVLDDTHEVQRAGLGRGARDPGRARSRRLDARPLEPRRVRRSSRGCAAQALCSRSAPPTWRSRGARRSSCCAARAHASRTRRSPS